MRYVSPGTDVGMLLIRTAILAAFAVSTPPAASGGDTTAQSEGVPYEATIEKASVSFRIAFDQWKPDDRFQELLSLFEKHRGVTDEITFFIAATVAPLPLDAAAAYAEVLAQRMKEVRARGYSTGINVLATLGQGWKLRQQLAWQEVL